MGPLTVPSIIGREFTDQGSLTLAQAPAYLAQADTEDGDTQYAVLIGESLGRRALMDLLYTVAPYKAHGPDRFARVLDNWHLHDRAKTSSGSENLLLQHANSLKFSWHEFARHRERFIAIFEDETERTRLLPVLTWKKERHGRREWQFDSFENSLVSALQQSTHEHSQFDASSQLQWDSLLGLVTIPYFLPELRRSWRAWQPLTKDGKSNYIGPASVPTMALMHRRALLNSAFIKSAEACIDGNA